MSGGSFNYLYLKEVREIFNDYGLMDTLKSMEETLREYGYEDAAQETAKFHELILSFYKNMNELEEFANEPLRQVWKAVEYYISCDCGADSVEQAICLFRNKKLKEKKELQKQPVLQNTYILETNYGVAVINANSPEHAVELLKEKEQREDCICLSFKVKPEDFKLLFSSPGVITWFATG